MEQRTHGFSQADLNTPELDALVEDIKTDALDEASLEEHHIPIYFKTVEELLAFVANMYYIDQELQPIQARVNEVTVDNNNKGILQLNRELFVAQRLMTIQKWKSFPESDPISRNWFRRKLTDNFVAERDAMPHGVRPLGMKMSMDDWNQYSSAFVQLFDFSILAE